MQVRCRVLSPMNVMFTYLLEKQIRLYESQLLLRIHKDPMRDPRITMLQNNEKMRRDSTRTVSRPTQMVQKGLSS